MPRARTSMTAAAARLLVLLGACAPACLAASSFPLPPVHPLLLPVALPPVARRQMEVPAGAGGPEPSCAELRAMWRHMRRMGRQMEFTNEIPKLQDPFTASAMDRLAGGRRRLSKYPDPNPYMGPSSSKDLQLVFQQRGSDQFGEVLTDLRQQQQLQRQAFSPNRVLGGVGDSAPAGFGRHEFDEFPGNTARLVGPPPRSGLADGALAPDEPLVVYGTVVHTPEERARYRSRNRKPPVFGINKYRNRWDDSTGLGRVPFRAKQPHTQFHYGSVVTRKADQHPLGGFAEFPEEVGQRSPGSGIRVERIDKLALVNKLNSLRNTCLQIQGRTCKTDVDCFCGGSPKLFCGGNRCRPLIKPVKYGNQKWSKSWQVAPYERNLLAYEDPKRDPAWPGPF